MLLRELTGFTQPSLQIGETHERTRGELLSMAEPVTAIDALQNAAGLADDAWEVGLLRAADAAGNHDGNVSVAELDRYLAAPDDIRFVSASAVRRMRAELVAPQRVGLQTRPVHQFPQAWQRALAERADAHSNGDGLLAETELDEELVRGINGGEDRTRRVSDQGIAMLRSRIAGATHEPDLLRVTDRNGAPPRGLELLQRYARIVYDPSSRVPSVVSYVLSAADLRETNLTRDGSFTVDPALPRAAQSRPADYEGSGLDLGHMRPSNDSATAEAMREGFKMPNVAPFAPTLNRHAWAQLEAAVSELVAATDGYARVFVGSLFLNERGEPTQPQRWITRRLRGVDVQRVGVPTHFFKVVLLEQPNGALTLVGFVVPNTDDLPTTRDAMRTAVHATRRSVQDIERMSGRDLLRDLPDDVERPMEASPDACIALPPGVELHAVTLLWPKDCRPQSWTLGQPGQPGQPVTRPQPPPLDDSNALTRFFSRLKFW